MNKQEWRVTFHVIRSGQPRPYADTEYVAQVRFEHKTPYTTEEKRNEWQSLMVNEQQARMAAQAFFGYMPVTKNERGGWWESYLDYFKPIDGKHVDRFGRDNPEGELRATAWEFRTVTPFTD